MFKIGDEVIRTMDGWGGMREGDKDIVIDVSPGSITLRKYGKGHCPSSLKLIKEGTMSIKDRIEQLTAWDKEADDLLEEMFPTPGNYSIRIPITSCNGNIGIWKNLDFTKEIIKFNYNSQCEKLEAFKKALLYLAEKAGKLEPELIGKEVKADIEGKTYKVRVLEVL